MSVSNQTYAALVARVSAMESALVAAKARLIFANKHIDCQEEIEAIEKVLSDRE